MEAYPYGAGSTAIGAYFLDPDRLPAWGVGPHNIVLVGTGERLADNARLREVRATDPGAACIVEFLDERDAADRALLERALAFPDSIVASDAMPVYWPDGTHDSTQWPLPPGGHTHPRTAGTFAKSMRRMVVETGSWSWLEAFRRCSYLPARVLDDVSPAMRGKGRLSVGSDADIVVLDPGRHHATPQRIWTPSGRPSGFGTCWWTAPSWSATASWSPTRCPVDRSVANLSEAPARRQVSTVT